MKRGAPGGNQEFDCDNDDNRDPRPSRILSGLGQQNWGPIEGPSSEERTLKSSNTILVLTLIPRE